MLRAEHLCKTFTTKRRRGFFHTEKLKVEAVRDVSLSVPRGKIVGLLGLNGAGKTTTIKMLTTLLDPTAGTYTLDGTDAVASLRSVKQRVNLSLIHILASPFKSHSLVMPPRLPSTTVSAFTPAFTSASCALSTPASLSLPAAYRQIRSATWKPASLRIVCTLLITSRT